MLAFAARVGALRYYITHAHVLCLRSQALTDLMKRDHLTRLCQSTHATKRRATYLEWARECMWWAYYSKVLTYSTLSTHVDTRHMYSKHESFAFEIHYTFEGYMFISFMKFLILLTRRALVLNGLKKSIRVTTRRGVTFKCRSRL